MELAQWHVHDNGVCTHVAEASKGQQVLQPVHLPQLKEANVPGGLCSSLQPQHLWPTPRSLLPVPRLGFSWPGWSFGDLLPRRTGKVQGDRTHLGIPAMGMAGFGSAFGPHPAGAGVMLYPSTPQHPHTQEPAHWVHPSVKMRRQGELRAHDLLLCGMAVAWP